MKNLFGYVTCKILPYGICIVLSSCIQNNKQRVVHAVEAMLGRHIIMPNDMCQFSQKGDSVVYMNSSQDHIFIYFSSDYCPECNVWRIQEWRNIESQFDRVQFVYIISTDKTNLHEIKEELDVIDTSKSLIYLDINNSFENMNPFINGNPIYHVFWTDSDNKIKIVGDPFYSQQMYDMYKKYYKSMKLRQ